MPVKTIMATQWKFMGGGTCYDSPNVEYSIAFGCRDCQTGFSYGDYDHL